jgi:hypothetical protein
MYRWALTRESNGVSGMEPVHSTGHGGGGGEGVVTGKER